MAVSLRLLTAVLCMLTVGGIGYAGPVLMGVTGNVNVNSPTSRIVDIDLATGSASNPRDTGIFLIGGIATQSSSGTLFGLTTSVSSPANSLIIIDVLTGAPTLIGPTGLTGVVEGDLAFNPVDGLLYGVQQPGGAGIQRNLFRINPTTGNATVVGSTGSVGDLSAVAFDNSGVLFAIDSSGSGNSLLHTINTSTGLIASTATMNVNLGSVVGMTFDPATNIAYVADGGDPSATFGLHTLDISTATLSLVGLTGISGGMSGLAFVSVPEPSSILLAVMAASQIAFGIARRNRVGTSI